eukprot:COSAG02_NODE_1219_length_13812_cov_108.713629_8_plen_380_part_00
MGRGGLACCCGRPPTPAPTRRYASTLEVVKKRGTTPYSASELNEYAWGNAFQAHSRIAESVIAREERVLMQLAQLPTEPPAPPKPRRHLPCCCVQRTHPDDQTQLYDPVELAQHPRESLPPPPPSPPKPEPTDDAKQSPGEEIGSTFAPGGRSLVSDPQFLSTPKRVAKKELFQNERARAAEQQLAAINKKLAPDTPMQRERDRAAELAKARQQALIAAGHEVDMEPPSPRKKQSSVETPLMRQKRIDAAAQRVGFEGTEGYEARVAYLVAAREGWTEAQPYPTHNSPLDVLKLAPPPPRPANFPLREDLVKLKLLDLCQQCERRGVTDQQLDDAMHAKNPKSEVITLLLETFKIEVATTTILPAQVSDGPAEDDQEHD